MESQHWINSLCGGRVQWTKTPWVIDGRTCATNGYYLVVLDGEVEGVPPAPAEVKEKFSGVLNIPALRLKRPVTVSLPDLKAWAGAVERRVETTIKCPECDGEGEEECSKCGHMAECEVCGGKKTIVDVQEPEKRHAKLCGELFDRNLLAQVLEHLGGDTCAVEVGVNSGSPARIAGTGWLVVVMPLLAEAGPEGEPFPKKAKAKRGKR